MKIKIPNKINCPKERINKFFKNVSFDPKTECWNYKGFQNNSGHIRVSICGQMMGVHRFTYQLFYGPIQDGKIICHRCDNPRCCTPDHLFEGYPKDNSKDMAEKGRSVHSEDNYFAVHSNDQILEIFKELKTGKFKNIQEAATHLKVNRRLIEDIIKGVRWTHLTGLNKISGKKLREKLFGISYNNQGKLTRNQVLEIRELHDQGMPLKEIHELFPIVTKTNIGKVARRKTYKHI